MCQKATPDTTDHLQENHEKEREENNIYTYHDCECDEVDNVLVAMPRACQTASARTDGDRESVVVIAQRNNLPPAHPDLPGPLSNTSNITKSQQ